MMSSLLEQGMKLNPASRLFISPMALFGLADIRFGKTSNLDVQPGGFIAILGPNGSGKSTLVKAILGQIPLIRVGNDLSASGTEGTSGYRLCPTDGGHF